MSLKKLSLNELVFEVQRSTGAGYPRQYGFVLGSGASRSSGILTGEEMTTVWDWELWQRNSAEHTRWCEELGITEKNRGANYGAYFTKRFEGEPDQGRNYIERTLQAGRPSIGYLALARIMTQSPHNLVLTTNFDCLPEDAINCFTTKRAHVFGHEDLAAHITAPVHRPTIVKLHRDMLFEPRTTTDDLLELPKALQDALDRLLQVYHPIFIGYGGNDASIMRFLMNNISQFQSERWKLPYWTFYGRSISSEAVRNFLNKVGGYCIFACDFDDFMMRLSKALSLEPVDMQRWLDSEAAHYRDVKESAAVFARKFEAEQLVRRAQPSNRRGGSLQERESLLRQAIQLDPQNASAHFYLFTLLYGKNQSEAEQECRTAIRIDSGEVCYHNGLALLLDSLGRHEEAAAERAIAASLRNQTP